MKKVSYIKMRKREIYPYLNLTLYDDENNYTRKLLPIFHKGIQPVHVICPSSMVCGTAICKARSLVQNI